MSSPDDSVERTHARRHVREDVRTYVVLHYHGRPLAGSAPPPGEAGRYVEADPLGTVEARTAADAKAQAARRWPAVPPRSLRTRTARQAGPGPLAVALARDAARDALARERGPGGPPSAAEG